MLEQLLPAPRKIEKDVADLAAPPDVVWQHVRHADLADSPFVRALFALRTLPGLVRGEDAIPSEIRIDQLRSTPESPGFQVLGEEPGRELTVGAIGKVWQLDIPFRHVDGAEAFAAFAEPGWIKVAWALRIEPLRETSSRVTIDLRVDATDDDAWRKFEAYWRIIGPGSHFVRRALFTSLRRRFGALGPPEEAVAVPGDSQLPDPAGQIVTRADQPLPESTLRDVASGIGGAGIMLLAWLTPFLRSARNHWGLTAEEADAPRPGDELVPEPRWSWTHAIEVPAAAERVWPWIVQIGADRAGFYSYQWLENLVGCHVRNADAVDPERAHAVGDGLVLHPEVPALRIVSIEPGRSLVAFGAPDEAARAAGKPWATGSWAFLVEPLGTDRCRVVSRFRSACSDDLASRLVQGPTFLEPVGFAMDRRMLLGIRERVIAAEKQRADG